jgi:hypothetical protein
MPVTFGRIAISAFWPDRGPTDHPPIERTEHAMTDTDEDVLVDDEGYPTEWGLRLVRNFSGTPNQFVDLLGKLWRWPSFISRGERMNDEGKLVMRLRLATGGWSGHEEIISELGGTFFSFRFWQSSHRGGKHVYDVPKADWDTVSQLGALTGPDGETSLERNTISPQGKEIRQWFIGDGVIVRWGDGPVLTREVVRVFGEYDGGCQRHFRVEHRNTDYEVARSTTRRSLGAALRCGEEWMP